MKQVIHNLNDGSIDISDIPIPNNSKSEYLIRSVKSLISTGTERMLIEFGNSNYLNKALKQPEKVKMVLEKIKNEGLSAAYETVSPSIGIGIWHQATTTPSASERLSPRHAAVARST